MRLNVKQHVLDYEGKPLLTTKTHPDGSTVLDENDRPVQEWRRAVRASERFRLISANVSVAAGRVSVPLAAAEAIRFVVPDVDPVNIAAALSWLGPPIRNEPLAITTRVPSTPDWAK